MARKSYTGWQLFVVLMISCTPFCLWAGARILNNIQFDRGCEGHLKRAADANTIAVAIPEVDKALKYIEDNDLTEGYTSILYNTPDEDIGYWYKTSRLFRQI